MLSNTDLHLLAGLLITSRKPDCVEIDIADLLRDEDGQSYRDICIKVLTSESGPIAAAFAAVEAKIHERRIDTTHFDRLSRTLNEIPGPIERAIVSSSGFTDPAIAKAQQLGLSLYLLESQSKQQIELSGIKIPPNCELDFDEPRWEWVSHGQVVFRPTEDIPPEELARFSPSLTIVDSAQGTVVSGLTLMQYFESIMCRPAREILGAQADTMPDGEASIILRINLQDRPVVLVNNRRVSFDQIRVDAVLRRQTARRNTVFSMLRNQKTQQPYGSAAIAEYSNNNLLGLVRQADYRTQIVVIPPHDRRRAQIREKTLKR
jgi:hypothetical protein